MKRTIATLTFMAALALACGESDDAGTTTDGPTVAPPEPPKPPPVVKVADTNTGLNARWNGLGLPVGDAMVIASDETVALMVWETGDFPKMTGDWKGAFTTAGWTVTDTFTDTDFEAAIYTKDGAELGWAIGADQGAVLVYLEDLKLIPAEESTVRQAKTGTKKITRNTGPRTLRNSDGSPGTGTTTGGGRTLNRGGGTGGGTGGGEQSGGGRTLGR